jgi:hypothetical protein
MSLVRTAYNAKRIVREKAYCPVCNERFYAPFDKLYIAAYGKCFTCDDSTDGTADIRSDNIFTIIVENL